MSTLRVNTIQDTAGSGSPAINGLARAWVNFNGTNTVAIRAALNVSSITDNGTGDYTVNFTNAMSDANYTVVGSAGRVSDVNNMFATNLATYSSTAVRLGTLAGGSAPSFTDMANVSVAIFR